MLQQISDPLRIFHICFSPRHGFHVLCIDEYNLEISFKQVKNGFPVHASPNLAKNVIDWEYTIEILRSDLRAYLRDQPQALPPHSVLSHEGSCPQDPGALHVQNIPSSASASGGQHHV